MATPSGNDLPTFFYPTKCTHFHYMTKAAQPAPFPMSDGPICSLYSHTDVTVASAEVTMGPGKFFSPSPCHLSFNKHSCMCLILGLQPNLKVRQTEVPTISPQVFQLHPSPPWSPGPHLLPYLSALLLPPCTLLEQTYGCFWVHHRIFHTFYGNHSA